MGIDLVEGEGVHSAFNSLSSLFNVHPIQPTQFL